ncbi:MAG: PLP-dependent aminotransferase family protein [Spirochaetales bacterium]|nr:PLP-dependent aminotransferase family protein [Spirochaetales bacterium]
MILIKIDKDSSQPLYLQISEQIQLMIEDGRLKQGDTLPSSRSLSTQLEMNRTTITKAYENLWAMGYTESQSGSYTRIRGRELLCSMTSGESGGSSLDWTGRITPSCSRMIEKMNEVRIPPVDGDLINLSSLSPDSAYWPLEDFKKCITQAAFNGDDYLFSYGDPAGYLPLRKNLAEYLRTHQIRTSADEIIITSGSQSAIDLVFRSLLKEGDVIITENPTYGYLIPLLQYYNCRIESIEITEEGMNLDALEHVLKTVKPALIYTMPNFQNPTGITTSQDHRERLLSICERQKIPLIEDGFVEELKYTGKTILPIKSMDKKGMVIYLGTFSKVLFPGLRTGWIAAPKEYIEKLSTIKNSSELCGNNLTQAAFSNFLSSGLFEKYVRKIHGRYKNKMSIAMGAARKYLHFEHLNYTKPSGGYTFWVSIRNVNYDEQHLIRAIEDAGVSVSPGSKYFVQSSEDLHFRISIAMADAADIEKAIEIIGGVVAGLPRCEEGNNVPG